MTESRWGGRPKLATDDYEWLLIRFEQAALDIAEGVGGDERAAEYGALRHEILRLLRAAEVTK